MILSSDKEGLEFQNQFTQEYYAAEALLDRLPMLSDVILKREYLNYLKWTAPIMLMLSLVCDEQADRLVKLALEVDLFLGATMAGQVKPEIQLLAFQRVQNLNLPEWLNVEILGWIRTELAIREIFHFLESQDPKIFRKSFLVLERISPDLALKKLREEIDSANPLQLFSAGETIGKIGFEKAMIALNNSISEPNFLINWKSKDTSEISSEYSLKAMLKAIENGTPDLRWKAALVLGEIGSDKAVSSLNKAVRDPEFLVRWNAVNALGKIKSPDTIHGLLIALNDGDLLVRGKAAEALGKGYFENAVPELLEALQDDASIVRQEAARALETLKSDKAILGLLKLVSHSDSWVSKTAAFLLSQIPVQIEEAVNLLPKLSKLLIEDSCENALIAMHGIQEWCKFYNSHFIQSLPSHHISMPNANKSLRLFFSYAHTDELLRDGIAAHLSLLQRQGIIATWHDRNITAGTDWEQQIDTHLSTADIILLLISADFLASDYCYEIEMQRAIERHNNQEARVIPVILRPCDWQSAPFGKLQALPIAQGAGIKPVTTWNNLDEAFSAVSQGIRKVAEEIRRQQVTEEKLILQQSQNSDFTGSIIIYGDYIAGNKIQGDNIEGGKYDIDSVGILNTGNVTNQGDQIGEQKT